MMLSADQISTFHDQGFVVVEDVFDPVSGLSPLRCEYDELLGRLYDSWVANGAIAADPQVTTFESRLLRVYQAGLDYFQPLDISLPPGDITADIPFHAGEAIFNIITDEKLLNLIGSIIGDEITSNPIQHVRLKPPVVELNDDEIRPHITRTEWHQDRAVTLEEANATRMVTAWLAISDATPDNGCLQVVPASHKSGMKLHCPQPQLGIPTKFFDHDAAVPLPVRAEVLFCFIR